MFCHPLGVCWCTWIKQLSTVGDADQVRVVLPTRPVGDTTLEQLRERLRSTFQVDNPLAGFRTRDPGGSDPQKKTPTSTENNLRETG